MRYAVSIGAGGTIVLPAELADALGGSGVAEVERAGEGLIVRPLSNDAVWSDRAAQLKRSTRS
jgi:hypothetical protein